MTDSKDTITSMPTPGSSEDIALLSENLATVRTNIAKAAEQIGRDPDSVRILPVTKFVPVERMRMIADLGLDWFGESRVQELRQKATELPGADWVFIGHLQTNKAGQASRIVSEVQSVNSLRIAASLSRTRVAWMENAENPDPRNLRVLLQVNTSGEETKSGFEPRDVDEAINEILALPGLKLGGFMTMAPHVDDEDEVRRAFADLRKIRDDMANRYEGDADLGELSMGMSHDYQIAVQEGATILRLGTVLFGDRYT